MNSIFLNNGNKIPIIGLGTWLMDNDFACDAVKNAIKAGYRLIDTAQAYRNEAGVGKGIRASGISREKIFVTDKVRAEHKDYKVVRESIEESLKLLELDFLDLMLIHSPQPWPEFRTGRNYFAENKQVWKALEDACEEGLVKSIGVSNFKKEDLKNIIEECKIVPAVNQVLCHPGQTPFELIDFCKTRRIAVEAYSPIAHGEAYRIDKICDMAKKYKKTVPQICIRYCIELGLVVLPKAQQPEHLYDNLDVDFSLSSEDVETLKGASPLEDYGKDGSFPVFQQSGM